MKLAFILFPGLLGVGFTTPAWVYATPAYKGGETAPGEAPAKRLPALSRGGWPIPLLPRIRGRLGGGGPGGYVINAPLRDRMAAKGGLTGGAG